MKIHKFLYMPNSAKTLLKKDLLEQLQTTITFKNGEVTLEVNNQKYIQVLNLTLAIKIKEEISEKISSQVFPGVWASNVPKRAKNTPP